MVKNALGCIPIPFTYGRRSALRKRVGLTCGAPSLICTVARVYDLSLINVNKSILRRFSLHFPRTLFPILAAGFIASSCSRAVHDGPQAQATTRTATSAAVRTDLDDYVSRPDTNYTYQLVNAVQEPGRTVYILEMTSQAWLTTNEVDRPIWKHWVTIVKPDNVTSSKALLFIGGGANGGKPPKSADGNLTGIAMATKSVVAELKMVPNQPLVFAGETE